MSVYTQAVIAGVILGFIARAYMLRSDYRQYPGYPHGVVSHLSLGLVAAFLGALITPALAAKEYTAVTFLTLAAQQFRDVRNMERESLLKLDQEELVPRGNDYIEGIARVFEARNYLVMITSLVASGVTYWFGWVWGLIGAAAVFLLTGILMKGEMVGDIAEVLPARVSFEGASLKIEDVVVMNVGLPAAREKILKDALGLRIVPKNANARATLHDLGQRQAILNVASVLLGTQVETGEQEWTPLARKEVDSGEIVIFMIPQEKDQEALIKAVKLTPVLESAKRRPLKTGAGRMAAD